MYKFNNTANKITNGTSIVNIGMINVLTNGMFPIIDLAPTATYVLKRQKKAEKRIIGLLNS